MRLHKCDSRGTTPQLADSCGHDLQIYASTRAQPRAIHIRTARTAHPASVASALVSDPSLRPSVAPSALGSSAEPAQVFLRTDGDDICHGRAPRGGEAAHRAHQHRAGAAPAVLWIRNRMDYDCSHDRSLLAAWIRKHRNHKNVHAVLAYAARTTREQHAVIVIFRPTPTKLSRSHTKTDVRHFTVTSLGVCWYGGVSHVFPPPLL